MKLNVTEVESQVEPSGVESIPEPAPEEAPRPKENSEASEVGAIGIIGNVIKQIRGMSSGQDREELQNGECLTGKGIKIGIIDTGVDYTHEDLGGCFGSNCKVIGGFDFVNDDNDPIDDHGHGTHVAATAAGKGRLSDGRNIYGVAPDANIVAYKVLNQYGRGYFDDIIAAIERSADPNQDGNFEDHLDVISLSLGGIGGVDDPPSLAVDNAVNIGIVAATAGGNSGPAYETLGTPGSARKSITVGATWKKDYQIEFGLDSNPRVDQITSFSSRGPSFNEYLPVQAKPDIVAPGALICAARIPDFTPWDYNPFYDLCLDNEHVHLAGTSMSTPFVSGAVALLKQAHPDWSPEMIKAALVEYVNELDYDVNIIGNGRLDVLKAFNGKLLIMPNSIAVEAVRAGEVRRIPVLLKNVGNTEIISDLSIINSDNRIDISISQTNVVLQPHEEREIQLEISGSTEQEPYFNHTSAFIRVQHGNDIKMIPVSYYIEPVNDNLGEFNYGLGENVLELDYDVAPMINYLSSGDIDEDAVIDVLLSGRPNPFYAEGSVYEYDFDGTRMLYEGILYQAPLIDCRIEPYSIGCYSDANIHSALGDLNGDRLDDIVVGGVQGFVKVLYNKGNISLNTTNITLQEGESFIFDGIEFKLHSTEGNGALVLGLQLDAPNSTCVSNLRINSNDYPRETACETTKIKLLNTDGTYRATLELTEGKFRTVFLERFEQTAYGPVIADFDNDSDLDFAITHSPIGPEQVNLDLFRNEGDGNLSHSTVYQRGMRATDMEAGDFDRDGDVDILLSLKEADSGDSYYDYGRIIMIENENGNFVESRDFTPIVRGEITQRFIPADHRINIYLTSADYDDDGDLDLVIGDNSGIVEYLRNDGNANFVSIGEIFDFGGVSWGLTSNDFNNNGNQDVIVGSRNNFYRWEGHLISNRN